MDWLRQDLGLAVRALSRRPGFTLLAVLTLALGLGVNTVAFSAVNALLFKPFRMAGAETTGWLFVSTARDPLADASLPVFDAIAQRTTTLDAFAAEGRMAVAYDSGHVTREIWALVVSPEYFSVVQTTPLIGRTIGGRDGTDGDIPVLVSERFWQTRLDEDPAVLSRTMTINRQRAFVVGVLRDGFQGPGGVFEPDIWLPLAALDPIAPDDRLRAADTGWLTLLARPKAGMPIAAVEQETVAIAASAGSAGAPSPAEPLRAQYVRFADGHPESRALGHAAALGMAAVGLVLLVACFNVAGLVLVRVVERRRDLGLQAALGASRFRLVRQQVIEAFLVATAASAFALLLAYWSESLLSVFSLPAPIPQRLHFAHDWRVVAFTALLAFLATVIPSLAPVLQAARTDLARSLGAAGTAARSGHGQRRARRAFVLLQVAGSTSFLALAIVFGTHFAGQLRSDPGFHAAQVAVMEINPSQYGHRGSQAREFSDRLVATVRATPGMAEVAVTDRVSFFVGAPNVGRISLSSAPCDTADCPRAGTYAASPSFFAAMGIPLVLGRAYDPENPTDRDAVVVSAHAAELFWPGEYPIGRAFQTMPDGRTFTVVGVAADIVHRMPGEPAQAYVYRPLEAGDFERPFTVVARAAGAAEEAAAALGRGAYEIDPHVPPQSIQTMRDRMALPLWMPRTLAGFFGVCGAAALLLSTIGLFGVTYAAVSQRRREFGVRFALGAKKADVVRQVVGEAFRLAGPGILIGAALAFITGYAARSLLYGLSTTALWPHVAAVVVQAAIAAAASWSPAARAARSNPLEVLRADS